MNENNFVHLHVHSEYSLLDGACRIKDLIESVAKKGMQSVAITDHGVMYGVVDFYEAAKKNNIKPIIGCEVYTARRTRFDKTSTLDSDYGHLILLAENNVGYKNLIKIVSYAFTEGYYYKPRVDIDLLRKYSEGIICTSACLGGDIPRLILEDNYIGAKEKALEFQNIFGANNFFLEIQSNGIEEQILVNQQLIKLSEETGIPLVATNDVHYINKDDARAQDVLMCIQMAKRLSDENRMKFSTQEIYLRSPDEMKALFAKQPEAIRNTVRIAERCNVELEFGRPVLPNFEIPGGLTSSEYLRKLSYEGAVIRYGDELSDKVKERLDYELSVINTMGYPDYYLIVWDFIKYAKDNDIPVGPGRGSGAGSLAAYCLGITNIDSLKYNLLFERFLNPERISMPDFDVDFCYEKRPRVIEYVVNKYGEDRVAQIITFGTMAARGAIRDVGRVLDMPYGDVDQIAKLIPMAPGSAMTISKALELSPELKAKYEQDDKVKDLIDTAKQLEGMPRHSSTHAAGVVLTRDPVTDYVPVQKTEDSIVTQFSMGTLDKLGLLKIDFLGLRTLTVIKDSIDMIKANYGIKIDFENMVMEDPKIFKLISDGKTIGLFQLESPGMTRFMTELQPDNLEDIIAGISLYRPGPMDQIPTYIANKRDINRVKYAHPILEHILNVTHGCMIYQEQVMQIVREMAGYSMGQADLVRRAMSKKKHDVMEKERSRFIEGSNKNGVSEDVANGIFDQMSDFASYAFNKSHAACYAVVAYQTAWLKVYYPVEFMASMMNSFLGSGEKVAQYVAECNVMGITVLPPSINESFEKFTVAGKDIRFGLIAIKNVGINAVRSIIVNRNKEGAFKNFKDFCTKIDTSEVNKRCIESFIKAGVFDCFGVFRSKIMAIYEKLMEAITSEKRNNIVGQISIFDFGMEEIQDDKDADYPDLKEFPSAILLAMEKEMLGLYVSGHPLMDYKDKLASIINLKSSDLIVSDEEETEDGLDLSHDSHIKDNMQVTIGGIIASKRTKTTRNNAMMAFVTLEDMSGIMELIVFPKVYERYSELLVVDSIVVIKGRLSLKEDDTPKIIFESLTPISQFEVFDKKPITYKMDKKKLEQIQAFVKYFSGNLNINFISDENDELLFSGHISKDKKVIKELELLLQK